MNRVDDVYVAKGFADREDYLKSLSEKYGLEVDLIAMIADLYGEEEDFDSLVSTLQDIA